MCNYSKELWEMLYTFKKHNILWIDDGQSISEENVFEEFKIIMEEQPGAFSIKLSGEPSNGYVLHIYSYADKIK